MKAINCNYALVYARFVSGQESFTICYSRHVPHKQSCRAKNCSVCLFRTSLANDDSIRMPSKNPSTFTFPMISVEKLRRCALFVAKSQRSLSCANIFIQQGVLVLDWVKCCVSHLRDNHLRVGHDIDTS